MKSISVGFASITKSSTLHSLKRCEDDVEYWIAVTVRYQENITRTFWICKLLRITIDD